MATFKDAKITRVHINSTNGTTSEITSKDIDADNTSLESTTGDAETDPDGAIFFTEETLEGTITFEDHDVLFSDTMNNGNTVETAMANVNKVYVWIETQGGNLNDSQGSKWLQVRPVVREVGDVSAKSANRKGELTFVHVDHKGVHQIA